MHVVMKIVLFYFAMWIQCVGQVYNVCVPSEIQYYGVMMCATDQSMDQSYIWVMCKGPIVRGHDAEPDAWIEDQSYWPVHVAKCTYAQSQVTALCQVRRTSYMGTQHSKSIAVKRRGYVQQYTESWYIKLVACTNMHKSSLINGIQSMSMSQCL